MARTPDITIKPPLVRALTLATLLCACGNGDGTRVQQQEPAPERDFAEVFAFVDECVLRVAPEDPIGMAADFLVWGERFVVLDRIQSNVKVFDRMCGLTHTLGRAGSGPGELRSPVRATVLPDGNLAVMDATGRISTFDVAGRYVRGTRTALQTVESFAAIPEGFLVGSVANGHLVHLVDEGGNTIRSFRRRQRMRHANEPNVLSASAVQLDRVLVSTATTTNRVEFVDRNNGKQWHAIALRQHYRAPKWPNKNIDDLRRLGVWIDEQAWVRVLMSINDSHVLVGVSRYDAAAAKPRVMYSVLTKDGREVVVTHESEQLLDRVVQDTAFDLVTLDDGNVRLTRYHVMLPEVP